MTHTTFVDCLTIQNEAMISFLIATVLFIGASVVLLILFIREKRKKTNKHNTNTQHHHQQQQQQEKSSGNDLKVMNQEVEKGTVILEPDEMTTTTTMMMTTNTHTLNQTLTSTSTYQSSLGGVYSSSTLSLDTHTTHIFIFISLSI
jgi:hypothetical protein